MTHRSLSTAVPRTRPKIDQRCRRAGSPVNFAQLALQVAQARRRTVCLRSATQWQGIDNYLAKQRGVANKIDPLNLLKRENLVERICGNC